jgi:hypothetical protein
MVFVLRSLGNVPRSSAVDRVAFQITGWIGGERQCQGAEGRRSPSGLVVELQARGSDPRSILESAGCIQSCMSISESTRTRIVDLMAMLPCRSASVRTTLEPFQGHIQPFLEH